MLLSFRGILFYQIDKLVIPRLTILPYQRILKEFIYGYLKLLTQCTCRRANVPFMIVDGFKVLFLRDSNGVQVT